MSTERIRGFVEITRPMNAIASGVLTFIGAFVAVGFSASLSTALHVGAAVCATVLAVGAGNTINDYFDREIDRINQPDRPIPRGAVSPREALWGSALLFAAAIVLALTLPVLAIAIAVVNLAALVAYTELFKGLPGVGNFVVAYLGGSTLLFGGAAVGTINATIVVLFALAALSTVAREIIKDVEDIVGDREKGLNTLPIAIGEHPATVAAIGFIVITLLISPIPYLLGSVGLAYLSVVIIADLVFCYAAIESFTDPAASQSHLKYAMFIGILAFVVGRVATLV
ncbi:MAG TPA: geranylgeranylglycerol-phosphate geranylgeranyltransferase [Halococcus sp.]|nr:geranylgeranylglycerol-phosphate geranylgeranyltransferase [Halococcus sp.]